MDERYKQLAIELTRLSERGKCALWFSSGKDSRLLLEAMLQLNLRFAVLCFDNAFSKEQKSVVGKISRQNNLLVYSYPPKAMTLIGDGENLALAAMYAVDRRGAAASVVTDFIEGEACAIDYQIKMSEKASPPIRFDTHILGSKKSDRHWAGAPVRDARWQVGEAQFAAPLFEWTDAQVLNALRELKIDYTEPTETSDTGNLAVCHNCLKRSANGKVFCPKEKKEIPVVEWNPEKNLENWKKC